MSDPLQPHGLWPTRLFCPCMGFPSQKYLSGLPFPSPGDLPNNRDQMYISCLAEGCFTTEPPGKPNTRKVLKQNCLLFNCWVEYYTGNQSPLDCKEIQPVHPKGNRSWIFIGRTDVEAETPILWPPDAKSWLIWKDPDAGIDWGREEKGMTKDEMAGWHHGFNGHGFGCTLGVGDGQGGLACCGSWGCKELDMTEQLNWTDKM